jgi:hypothetical protein
MLAAPATRDARVRVHARVERTQKNARKAGPASDILWYIEMAPETSRAAT